MNFNYHTSGHSKVYDVSELLLVQELTAVKVESAKKVCPEATVNTVWKIPVCKWGVCKRDILKHPVFNVLKFKGWIKRIFDTVD